MQKVEQENVYKIYNYYLLLTEGTHRHDRYLNRKPWVILKIVTVIANHVLIYQKPFPFQ